MGLALMGSVLMGLFESGVDAGVGVSVGAGVGLMFCSSGLIEFIS